MFSIQTAIQIVITFYTFCFIFGLIFNTLMAFCAFRSKRLTGVCHFLIGLHVICDILHQFGIIPLIYSFFFMKKISQRQCFFIEFIPISGICLGGFVVMYLGFDRLRAIAWPVSYMARSRRYLPVVLWLIFAVSLHSTFLGFAYQYVEEKEQVCSIITSLSWTPRMLWLFLVLCISLIVGVLYGAAAIALRLNATCSKATCAIFKSILFCCVMVVMGWQLTTLLVVVLQLIGLDQNSDLYFLLQLSAGLILNVLCASNYFIYYHLSSEYRIALTEQRRQIFSFVTWKKPYEYESSPQTTNV